MARHCIFLSRNGPIIITDLTRFISLTFGSSQGCFLKTRKDHHTIIIIIVINFIIIFIVVIIIETSTIHERRAAKPQRTRENSLFRFLSRPHCSRLAALPQAARTSCYLARAFASRSFAKNRDCSQSNSILVRFKLFTYCLIYFFPSLGQLSHFSRDKIKISTLVFVVKISVKNMVVLENAS